MINNLIRNQENNFKSGLISIFIHLFLFAVVIIASKINGGGLGQGLPSGSGKGGGGNYISAGMAMDNNPPAPKSKDKSAEDKKDQKVDVEKTKNIVSDDVIPDADKKSDKKKLTGNKGVTVQNPDFDGNSKGSGGSYGSGSFSQYGVGYGDTTGLGNFYSENSLNVSIKYPQGWTYVDQNKRSKLEGVTFWAQNLNFNPPPYIHIDVQDKYYFDARKYKYKIDMDNYVMYYNDPEVLAGQVKQEIYIRTNNAEDYSIKLIIKGEVEFRAFQPVFFGMIQTFKFGSSWF